MPVRPALPLLACLGLPACGASWTPEQQAALDVGAAPSTWDDLDPAHPGQRLRDPRTGIVFRRVPKGSFRMGDDAYAEEGPAHTVTLSRDYLLAENEVTIAQWRRYVRDHGGQAGVPMADDKDGALPVGHVLYGEAAAFCARYGYRLPTEAEWERACLGGQALADGPWTSDSELQRFAWFNVNSGSLPQPVGTRAANPFGLFDMLGNVWEYCSDYAANYGPGDRTDPTGPQNGVCHVHRGGSAVSAVWPTPTVRVIEEPGARSVLYGFRPARSAD